MNNKNLLLAGGAALALFAITRPAAARTALGTGNGQQQANWASRSTYYYKPNGTRAADQSVGQLLGLASIAKTLGIDSSTFSGLGNTIQGIAGQITGVDLGQGASAVNQVVSQASGISYPAINGLDLGIAADAGLGSAATDAAIASGAADAAVAAGATDVAAEIGGGWLADTGLADIAGWALF